MYLLKATENIYKEASKYNRILQLSLVPDKVLLSRVLVFLKRMTLKKYGKSKVIIITDPQRKAECKLI